MFRHARVLVPVVICAWIFGCQPKAPEPEPEETPKQAVGFPAAQARLNRVYTCPSQVTAYDPTTPSKVLGYFQAGSQLKLSDQVNPAGMVLVTYQDPKGPLITAMCYAADVGLGPPRPPAQPQPEAPKAPILEDPKGLSGSQPKENNPRYKPLGSGF